MKRRLLQYLACQKCQRSFEVHAEREEQQEILEGGLVCTGCRASFPVTRGIPRFLPQQLSSDKQATAAALGYEWTHYPELSDRYLDEFLDWIKPLDRSFFAGRIVLDAGCGKGRHADLAAQWGAREVIGIDSSEAVESAYRNTCHFPNVHVLQADIYSLPFLSPFDFAYSIGVLHHLPGPKLGFLSLVKHIKPGGRISIWVYGKEGNLWIEKLVNPVRVHLTSKLPKRLTLILSFFISLPLYAALKLVYRPARGVRSLRNNLPYAEYLSAISDFSFAENLWNVFDHLVAPTAFYHRREEVEEWFAAANLQQIVITRRNNNSWRGTGVTCQASAGET